MKIALIANPMSGAKNTEPIIHRVGNRLTALKIQFDLFTTRYHGHAIDIVKGLNLREYDAVVSMGGDGTNYHVLNGILKYNNNNYLPPLGIIPSGRGNSFARDLNLHTVEDGISALSGKKTRKIDVCCFKQGDEPYYFVNIMGFGFATDVARTAAQFRWAGDFSYVIGVFYRLMNIDFYWMGLEVDGKGYSGKNCFVEFCNSRYTAGNMIMAPGAKPDDGYFDVVITAPLSRISLISTLPKIFKGRHGENPAVGFLQGKSARVSTRPVKALLPDGEIFGSTPTDITILPRGVRYFMN